LNAGSTSTKGNFRLVQSEILTKGHPYFYLSRARSIISNAEYASLASWVMSSRKRGALVLQGYIQGLFPKKIEQVKQRPVFAKTSVANELYWCAAIIAANCQRISKFVDQSRKLEIEFLKGDFQVCLNLLDSMEVEFGYSQWLIENKVAILQAFKGIEAQKNYLQTIKNKGVSNLPWMALTYSRRNEETTTYFRFVSQTIDFLAELEDPSLRASLIFRALNVFPDDVDQINSILNYETNSPLVDIYSTFMSIAQASIVNDANPLRQIVVECLTSLVHKVSDPRINRLLFIAGISEEPRQSPYHHYAKNERVDDLYSETDENKFLASDWPIAWRNDAADILNVKANYSSDGTVQGEMTAELLTIFKEGSLADEAIGRKLKDCLNYRWFAFSNVMEEILWREFSSDVYAEKKSCLIRFINTSYLDPELLRYLDDAPREKYKQKIVEGYGQTFLVRSNVLLAERKISKFNVEEEDRDSAGLVLAELHLLLSDYDSTRAICAPLLLSDNVRTQRLAARILASAMESYGDIGALVEFVSSRCLRDDGVIHMLPFSNIVNTLDKKVRKEIAGSLSTSIVLSLYSRNYDDGYDSSLSFAYEDFLISKRLERPSELSGIVDSLDRRELVYYLRYICIPEIMKVSTVYNGSADLQNERIAVCFLLLSYDEENAKDYESEIREITRAQVIRRGVRHVEQSKMSIDVSALKKWADKKLKESFLRYQALLKAGFNPVAGFKEALLESLSAGKPMPREFFEVPTDEASALLKEIVYSIIQECTISPMHGLDCYLSMRIRHGALSGQLRGPLESEKIITQKNSDQESYSSNEYWMEKLSSIPQSVKDNIDINLCMFSASYDNLIEEVTNEFIQITTKEKPNGLFNVNFMYTELRLIATWVDEDSTFDEFFDQCIDLFWRSVDSCLKRVHWHIDSSLKPELNVCFNNLQDNIRSVAASYSTAELDRAIRTAQTNAQQALDQIKDWFKLPTPRVEPSFEMEELIDIGLQCVQRIHRDFAPVINKNIADLPPFADALTVFSDIFFIIFDNIRRYSSVGHTPLINIEIVREKGDNIRLVVENEVSKGADSVCNVARVDAIKKVISDGSYHNSVKSEGGTGLIKLKKIIGANQYMDFGYREGDKFSVEFSLMLRRISL
jgi:hypothetical protein